VNLRIGDLHGASLPDALADAARDRFDFEKSSDRKLSIVARILGRRDALNDPALAEAKRALAMNVLIRNVFQHNRGVVREDDVEKNGGPFTCNLGDRVLTVSVGGQLHRTLFDLEACIGAMVQVAHVLVP